MSAASRFDLTGKVAVVTGGNGGIGLGIAKALAEHGADVVIWGTSADKNAAAEAELKTIGGKVASRLVDVSQEAEVNDGMAAAVAAFGRVDSVFANAGVNGAIGPFIDMDTQAYERVVAININGVVFTLRAACRHMVARAKAGDPGGSLVAVSSAAAFNGFPQVAAYSTSKAALGGVIRSVAAEHAPFRIRANVIAPGLTTTDINRDRWEDPEVAAKHIAGRVPMQRWGTTADFSGAAVYLASDASSFHTGDYMLIDGGMSL